MNVTEITTVFDLTLRVGALLIANGATSQIVETTMQQITDVYGLPPCHPNVFPTFFSLSLEHPALEYPLTRVQRVRARTTNYGRLVQVFALVERLQRDHLSPQVALAAVEKLERKPLPDPLWIRLLSAAGVGFTLTVAALLALGIQVSHAGTAGWAWPLQLFAAGAASLCYGRASTVPRFALLYAGMIGVSGWLIYLLIPQNAGQDLLLATFLATLAAGCISRLIDALQQVPVVLYTLPGVFLFLPGYTIYQGMFAIVQGKSSAGCPAPQGA